MNSLPNLKEQKELPNSGISSREELDAFGKLSQDEAIRAWEEDRFGSQILPIDAPDLGEDGKLADTTHNVSRDEGLRETNLEALAG